MSSSTTSYETTEPDPTVVIKKSSSKSSSSFVSSGALKQQLQEQKVESESEKPSVEQCTLPLVKPKKTNQVSIHQLKDPKKVAVHYAATATAAKPPKSFSFYTSGSMKK